MGMEHGEHHAWMHAVWVEQIAGGSSGPQRKALMIYLWGPLPSCIEAILFTAAQHYWPQEPSMAHGVMAHGAR